MDSGLVVAARSASAVTVVVVAGCAKKTEQSRTPIAATMMMFSGAGATEWLRSGVSSGGRTQSWRPWEMPAAEERWQALIG
ncbi:hypothetical protein DEO72_LG5g1451 [Vigna unguiculata]|uniref:Uncharacterized protein n=1 Tax=Vigna unguiculata TaxID=3917 RepID=A0A4D6LZG9_VIGUN|nr:hypothetical protein DEO72_LG5g1451 [Vigna unguiculata]